MITKFSIRPCSITFRDTAGQEFLRSLHIDRKHQLLFISAYFVKMTPHFFLAHLPFFLWDLGEMTNSNLPNAKPKKELSVVPDLIIFELEFCVDTFLCCKHVGHLFLSVLIMTPLLS